MLPTICIVFVLFSLVSRIADTILSRCLVLLTYLSSSGLMLRRFRLPVRPPIVKFPAVDAIHGESLITSFAFDFFFGGVDDTVLVLRRPRMRSTVYPFLFFTIYNTIYVQFWRSPACVSALFSCARKQK